MNTLQNNEKRHVLFLSKEELEFVYRYIKRALEFSRRNIISCPEDNHKVERLREKIEESLNDY